MAKLFIVGFPREIDEIQLVELFTAHGQVNSITIITDKDTGISKGYGFITMTDKAGSERAIAALDGMTFGSRQMTVKLADDKYEIDQRSIPSQSDQRQNRATYHKVQSSFEEVKKKRPRKRL